MGKTIFKRHTSTRIFGSLLVMLVLFGWTSLARAEEGQMDLNAIIFETQKQTKTTDSIAAVWWMPLEAWEILLKQNPNYTEAQAKEILDKFHSYLYFMVVAAGADPTGGMTYADSLYVQTNTHLIDRQGQTYKPLSEDQLDPEVRLFVARMRPVMANILGPLGQHMHVFLFSSKDKNGQYIADTKKEGSFSMKVGESVFQWRLPLGSVLPPKTCPTCKETMSGAWKYCPWDGTKLE